MNCAVLLYIILAFTTILLARNEVGKCNNYSYLIRVVLCGLVACVSYLTTSARKHLTSSIYWHILRLNSNGKISLVFGGNNKYLKRRFK